MSADFLWLILTEAQYDAGKKSCAELCLRDGRGSLSVRWSNDLDKCLVKLPGVTDEWIKEQRWLTEKTSRFTIEDMPALQNLMQTPKWLPVDIDLAGAR